MEPISEAEDECTFSDAETFVQENLAAEGFPIMHEIKERQLLCDIKVRVGNCVINAHRIVLAATIPYFRAMFTNGMLESTQSEVTLQDMNAEALSLLLDFVYTGILRITVDNVQNIMVCASFLQLAKVKEACARFITKRLYTAINACGNFSFIRSSAKLTPDNVLGVRVLADTLNCSSVVVESDRFIQKNFLAVAKSEEFSQLAVDELKEILVRDQLNVDKEEQVYGVMMDWVYLDTKARVQYIPDLLKCIRMPLLSPEFISDIVCANFHIKTSHECRDLIDEAKDYFLMPERRPMLKTFRVTPRLCDDALGYIYVVGGHSKQVYRPNQLRKKILPSNQINSISFLRSMPNGPYESATYDFYQKRFEAATGMEIDHSS